jgi:hypothetical protein
MNTTITTTAWDRLSAFDLMLCSIYAPLLIVNVEGPVQEKRGALYTFSSSGTTNKQQWGTVVDIAKPKAQGVYPYQADYQIGDKVLVEYVVACDPRYLIGHVSENVYQYRYEASSVIARLRGDQFVMMNGYVLTMPLYSVDPSEDVVVVKDEHNQLVKYSRNGIALGFVKEYYGGGRVVCSGPDTQVEPGVMVLVKQDYPRTRNHKWNNEFLEYNEMDVQSIYLKHYVFLDNGLLGGEPDTWFEYSVVNGRNIMATMDNEHIIYPRDNYALIVMDKRDLNLTSNIVLSEKYGTVKNIGKVMATGPNCEVVTFGQKVMIETKTDRSYYLREHSLVTKRDLVMVREVDYLNENRSGIIGTYND